MWQSAQSRHSKRIGEEDVELGIEDARDQFPRAVCAPAYRSLTQAQQRFLRAMAPDQPGATMLSDIAGRTGKSMSWVGKYRTSLERAQMIHTADWGHGGLFHPLLRHLDNERIQVRRNRPRGGVTHERNIMVGKSGG